MGLEGFVQPVKGRGGVSEVNLDAGLPVKVLLWVLLCPSPFLSPIAQHASVLECAAKIVVTLLYVGWVILPKKIALLVIIDGVGVIAHRLVGLAHGTVRPCVIRFSFISLLIPRKCVGVFALHVVGMTEKA